MTTWWMSHTNDVVFFQSMHYGKQSGSFGRGLPFSQGMHIALDTGQYKMLHIVSKAVKAMAEGELLQLEKARRLDIKEEIYFDIIRKKTASLIVASCSLVRLRPHRMKIPLSLCDRLEKT